MGRIGTLAILTLLVTALTLTGCGEPGGDTFHAESGGVVQVVTNGDAANGSNNPVTPAPEKE